ncbi:MAG: c-type cytochrome [Steroidobacteraceae bacterium]
MQRRSGKVPGATSRPALAIGAAVVTLFAPLAYSQPAADGARVYAASCVACHQPTGAGIPGAFPPLVKHVPGLLAQPTGREYLVKAVLFGLEGRVRIEGADYQNVMPPWNALSDAEIAAVLDYVSGAWGNQAAQPPAFRSFTPEEVKAGRLPSQTAAAVLASRPGGASAGPVPAVGASQKVSFTAEQVARGKAIYTRRCVDCHGSTLDNGEFGGAPLNGAYFKGHWGAGPVAALIAYTKAKMPPDGPGSLSDQSYVEVVSYLLDANGYPRGDKELPVDVEAQQAMTLQFGP